MSRLALLIILIVLAAPARAEPFTLFSCTTDDADVGFLIVVAADDTDFPLVSGTQLQLDMANGQSLIYPTHPSTDPDAFAFAHSDGGDGYVVTLRFTDAGTSYVLYSLATPPEGPDDAGGGAAGLLRIDEDGTRADVAQCHERPYMFIEAMRQSFGCDAGSPFGEAGCAEAPATRIAPLPEDFPVPVAP